MAGKSFINGTRRLIYFGGSNEKAMSEADRTLGWNWTFWKRVLRPVIEEIGAKSVLYPALVAPDSPLSIRAGEAEGVEFCARQVGKQLFLLVCKREGKTVQVTFSGLPAPAKTGEVLFEAPRQMAASNGQFTDWFGPFEVHVYRFEL